MKKGKAKTESNNKDKISKYYDVNENALDALVNAEKQVKAEEQMVSDGLTKSDTNGEIGAKKSRDPYKIDKLSKLPAWLVAIFIKYWFCGAVCFFFLFGIGITDAIDISFVLGVAMGVVTDILINNAFRAFQNDRKNYNYFMMFPPKKFWTFFTNIIYAVVIAFCVMFTYQFINVAIINANSLPTTAVPFSAEPFGYSAIYLAWDMLFIGIKDLLVSIIKKAKSRSTEEQ